MPRGPEQDDVLLLDAELLGRAGSVEAESHATVGVDKGPEVSRGQVSIRVDDRGGPMCADHGAYPPRPTGAGPLHR